MQNSQNQYRLAQAASGLFILTSIVIYLIHLLKGRGFDWFYFDSLAAVMRSSILHYGTLPLHDPWACSGTSILANPQSWMFSPLFILTLLFSPSIGNIISIILLKILGFWGTYKYFSFHNINKIHALLLSSLFINSNWFALHFSEGHIVFRTFFLLPWVFYYFENLISKNNLLILGGLLLFFILDGGFYPLIFSCVYFLINLLLDKSNRNQVIYFIKNNLSFFTLALIGFCLMSLVKLIPILMNAETIKDVQETINLNFTSYLNIFFNPFENNGATVFNYLRFHEFGSYIGFSLALLFLYLIIRNRTQVKHLIPLLLSILIFLWMGTGLFGSFNPYQLISKLPIIKKAHVQSRYLILFSLFFLLFLGKLSNNAKGKIFVTALLLLANIEFLVSNQYAFYPNVQKYNLPLITRTQWTRTDIQINKPYIYYEEGLVSKQCYEPAQTFTTSRASQEPGYHGEFITREGQVFVGPVTLTPGEIEFKYSSPNGGELVLNTHYLDGWIETNLNAETFEINKLLGLKLPAGEGEVRLQYFPFYYNYLFLFVAIGLVMILYLMRKKL